MGIEFPGPQLHPTASAQSSVLAILTSTHNKVNQCARKIKPLPIKKVWEARGNEIKIVCLDVNKGIISRA